MDEGLRTRIEAFCVLSVEERLHTMRSVADDAWGAFREGRMDAAVVATLRRALVDIVTSGEGTGQERLSVGVLLGRIGDPRLRRPSDADYWARLTLESGDHLDLARFEVTNHEYRAWVDAGGYADRAAWSEEGWAWLQACENAWPTLAAHAETDRLLVPNQPVVSVTWFEADAYARASGARLPRWYERVWAVRGVAKRKYPWGSPFGEGNTNSKEEVLQRPCAVGLYVRDCTPDGIYDLAGNVGEWTAEQAGHEYLLHPGSWDQPSLAAWGKALTTEAPESRWPALGFRIARDVEE
jgi:hypothetical protein